MIRFFNLHLYKPILKKQGFRFATIHFPLPDLGQKIKEGKVKKLYVKEGDRIKEFSKIADVESDKQFTEITSPQQGTIKKIYYQEDTVCQVGDIFLDIQTNSEVQAGIKVDSVETVQHPKFQPIIQPSFIQQDFLASATVKMWARQHKVDLKQVIGTGKRGRVLKQDIINYIQFRKSQPIEGKTVKQSKSALPPSGTQVLKIKMNETEKEMYRLATYSNSIPYLYFQQNIEISQLIATVESLKHKNHKISLLSLLIKTFSLAINQYPKVNSIYSLSNQFSFKQSRVQNLLLPKFATDQFLLVKNLEIQSILSINNELNNQHSSKTLQSSQQNVRNSTICLSHIGQIGGKSLDPLIYGETVCHAALGSPYEKIIFFNGQLAKKMYMEVTVAGDHRVLDGASVAKFTMAWKEMSQNPKLAFLNMI